MAETTVLRSTASPKNASPVATGGGNAHAQLSGPLPLVQVTMSQGRPVQGTQPQKNVVVMPLRNQPGARPPTVQRTTGQLGTPTPAPQRPQRGQRQIAAVAPASELSSDQLMLCRHLLTQHLESENPVNGALASDAIAAIDRQLAAATVADEEAASAAATAAARRLAPGVTKVVVSSPRASQIGATAPRGVPSRVVPSRVVPAPAPELSNDVQEAEDGPANVIDVGEPATDTRDAG